MGDAFLDIEAWSFQLDDFALPLVLQAFELRTRRAHSELLRNVFVMSAAIRLCAGFYRSVQRCRPERK